MKTRLMMTTTALVLALATGARAQAPQDHQQHHPGATAAPAPAAPPTAPGGTQPGQMPLGQTTQGMPEHCRSMMQGMQGCMPMMQQMMQGRMGTPAPGGMDHGSMAPGTPAQPAAMTASTKAYVDAADRMHAPMMQGLQTADPDVAFVRGMVAHHLGAIEMAKVRIQYGKDEQTKRWAEAIVREQQREIDEMLGWLARNAR